MANGYWQDIEIGVCEAIPGQVDIGKWYFRTVTIPATTPSDQRLAVATSRYLDRVDETFVHHTWLQSLGKVKQATDDFPMSESEYIQ